MAPVTFQTLDITFIIDGISPQTRHLKIPRLVVLLFILGGTTTRMWLVVLTLLSLTTGALQSMEVTILTHALTRIPVSVRAKLVTSRASTARSLLMTTVLPTASLSTILSPLSLATMMLPARKTIHSSSHLSFSMRPMVTAFFVASSSRSRELLVRSRGPRAVIHKARYHKADIATFIRDYADKIHIVSLLAGCIQLSKGGDPY
mmetsp:Transcript_14057/g.40359  ORF Transcript_14057/g.40359 Transcript_14057/m.40359 type:complete len:204 (-) Transcript_14057:32-643(-)